MTIVSVAQGFNPVIASVSDLSAVAQRAKAETTQRRQPFSFRRPGLRAGTHNPGVNCSRRRLPNCRKRESSPYGSRRGGRDDVSGFFGFIKQRRGSHTPSQSRDSISPEFCKFIRPPKERGTQGDPKRDAGRSQEGRREDRVRAAPAVPCAKVANKNAHEHTGSAEAVRPSLRNGFTAYSVLSPVRPELVCHRHSQEA
jgi:hypothetical protein